MIRITIKFIEDGEEKEEIVYTFEMLGIWVSEVDYEKIRIVEVITHEGEDW